jgi:GNAT superfamily N-acetyltransferase
MRARARLSVSRTSVHRVVRIDPSLASCIDAYVTGWALSRGAPAPKEAEFGWYVPTGITTEPERYVLTRGTLEQVRRLRDTMALPGSCVKFAGQREHWLSLVDAGWAENPVGWFMTRGVEAPGMVPAMPPGCAVETGVHDRLLRVAVHADGQQVASGRAGLAGTWAVPDRIGTASAYQRRGLGRLVMHHLLHLAWEAGARRAVLDASPQGRQLYHSLGWLTVAGQFGIRRRDPAPDSLAAMLPRQS